MAKRRTTLLTQGVAGRLGGLQYVQGPTGTIWKSMPPPRLKFTPGERAQQDRVRRIAAAWRSLGIVEMEAWRDHAAAELATIPAMRRPPVAPYNAFLALGTRLLQVDPQAGIPRLPPTGPFGGDALAVTVAAFEEDDPLTPTPLPQRVEGLLYRADRPNSAGVVTELLAQRLLGVGRAPRPRGYVSQGFLAFAEGSLEAEVVCPPGWYACAVRFVRPDTGQDTAIFPCGIVGVGVGGAGGG